MPTNHPRISVVRDPELDEALSRVAPFFEGESTAGVVHELALRGASAIVDDEDERAAAVERLIEASTGPEPPFDRETLDRIDDLAWGR